MTKRIRTFAGLRYPVQPPAEAAGVPAHNVADLPPAANFPPTGGVAFVVRILDNPQGFASSTGSSWISEVDGSDLGPGDG